MSHRATALGIVAEYLGRLELSVDRKPQSMVKSVIGTAPPAPVSGTAHAREPGLSVRP